MLADWLDDETTDCCFWIATDWTTVPLGMISEIAPNPNVAWLCGMVAPVESALKDVSGSIDLKQGEIGVTCGCDRYDWLFLREGDNNGVRRWPDCNDEIGGGEICAQSEKRCREGCE